MSELSILQAFVAAGMTVEGACAMGGNIQAESGFKSNIAQRGMTEMSDDEYTAAADGYYILFSSDGVGYGLCQWTYPTRKSNLLKFARDCGRSVGDEAMQVQFCIDELKTDYPNVWNYLLTTDNIEVATELVCTDYERPAVNNTATRVQFANELYTRYGDKLESTMGQANPSTASTDYKKTALDFAMPLIKRGDKSPEARYLADKLKALGYDVLWSGLWACVVDFQQKKGLQVDGICGEKTWKEILK